MTSRLRQIWRDHQAMCAIRRGHGDVKLSWIPLSTTAWCFECELYQGRARRIHADPAQAILDAVQQFREENKS